jgi:hypothetical protein
MKGAFKVLNWLGKLARPMAAIVALGVALAAAWNAARGGSTRNELQAETDRRHRCGSRGGWCRSWPRMRAPCTARTATPSAS